MCADVDPTLADVTGLTGKAPASSKDGRRGGLSQEGAVIAVRPAASRKNRQPVDEAYQARPSLRYYLAHSIALNLLFGGKPRVTFSLWPRHLG